MQDLVPDAAGKRMSRSEDGMTGTMVFIASEVLRGIAGGAPFSRNKSHDLQSFLWTIIFIGYYSAIRAVERKDGSRPKPPVKIDHRGLRKEYHALFPSTTPQDLAESRLAAFRSSRPGKPYAGIQYLFLYATAVDEIDGHPDQGLIVLVMGAWSILRRCEPEELVFQKMSSSARHLSSRYTSEDVVALSTAAGASASAPLYPSGYRPSELSLILNHGELLQLLGDGLKALSPNGA
ncbi:hypothetical protein FKP32DRAFT_1756572 [Trametes sanguinea]|nr:hypothetical protein FKP32DRAFT_1756572 [Trametes sanguinea]